MQNHSMWHTIKSKTQEVNATDQLDAGVLMQLLDPEVYCD